MKHIAKCTFFITSTGFLGEAYNCSCGSSSTAAQMAGTPGGQAINALFGHRPCAGIRALHNHPKCPDKVEC